MDAASFLLKITVLASPLCCFKIYRVESALRAPSSVNQHNAPQHTASAAVADQPLSSTSGVPSGLQSLPLSKWLTGKAIILEKGFKVTRAFIYDCFVECCHHKKFNGPTNTVFSQFFHPIPCGDVNSIILPKV